MSTPEIEIPAETARVIAEFAVRLFQMRLEIKQLSKELDEMPRKTKRDLEACLIVSKTLAEKALLLESFLGTIDKFQKNALSGVEAIEEYASSKIKAQHNRAKKASEVVEEYRKWVSKEEPKTNGIFA